MMAVCISICKLEKPLLEKLIKQLILNKSIN